MNLFTTATAAALSLGVMVAATVDASAQRKDRFRSGTYVKSLFSDDKEIDCSLARGVSRFCIGTNARPRERLRSQRLRAKQLRDAGRNSRRGG